MVPEQVTQLLADWGAGDRQALDRLFPVIYEELRRLARVYLQRQPAGATLQSTALVHEAYLKLAGRELHCKDRGHFFAISARIMRCILVDHARSRRSQKRGGNVCALPLDEAVDSVANRNIDLIALDKALCRLGENDARLARVVELRFFGGLSVEETGEVLNISPASVKRDWVIAKSCIYRELHGVPTDGK